jgi:hypothetical protein
LSSLSVTFRINWHGGKDIDRGPEYAGLVQHGIRVLSTPKLMSSQFPFADFLGNQRVEIYSAM